MPTGRKLGREAFVLISRGGHARLFVALVTFPDVVARVGEYSYRSRPWNFLETSPKPASQGCLLTISHCALWCSSGRVAQSN